MDFLPDVGDGRMDFGFRWHLAFGVLDQFVDMLGKVHGVHRTPRNLLEVGAVLGVVVVLEFHQHVIFLVFECLSNQLIILPGQGFVLEKGDDSRGFFVKLTGGSHGSRFGGRAAPAKVRPPLAVVVSKGFFLLSQEKIQTAILRINAKG